MSVNPRLFYISLSLLLYPFLSGCKSEPAPRDIIKIMSYNVLKYGDGCQGSAMQLHGYLKTIISYTDPDILGLVKVEAIASAPAMKGKAPKGFEDSILTYALNSTHIGKYTVCPFTNAAKDNNQTLLFYNKNKFGFDSYSTIVTDLTDINMYKLYYQDHEALRKHDTAFLYIILVHTASGDEAADRDRQMAELMSGLRKQFPTLPDIFIMGDFNLRKTNEQGYQVLTNNAEKKYCFKDPPFAIDSKVSYPANWDKHPEKFAEFLSTSTRLNENDPNNCGTGGGAKDWYDHILISPSLANSSNFYYYIPGSYRTIGNDGNRIDKSVNDKPNLSAPTEVLNALFQMSNKYPVMIEFGIGPQN